MEQTKPAVSVLMPVYNGEIEHVKQAIESVLKQSFQDFELVIVDDGSSNGVEKLLAEYGTHEKVVLIRNANNMGVVATRNHGLTVCKGQFIACMDADDIALSSRLEKQFNFLTSNPDVDVCFSSFWHVDMEGNQLELFQISESRERLKAELFLNSRLCHSTMMCKKEALVKVGGYQQGRDYADDFALYISFLEHNYTLAGIRDVLLEYRISPGGLTRSRRSEQLEMACKIAFEHVCRHVDIRTNRELFQQFWFFIATQAEQPMRISTLLSLRPLFKYIRANSELNSVWWPEFLWISRKAIDDRPGLTSLLNYCLLRFVL